MTAQRRSWMLRAGMLVAVVAGSIGLGSTPAVAAAPLFSVSGPVPATLTDFQIGGSAQNVKFTVADVTEATPPTPMTASLSITGGDFDIPVVSGCNGTASSCTFPLAGGGSVDLNFSIAPKTTIADVPVGSSKSFTATLTVDDGASGPVTKTFSVKVVNPAPLSVSGEIYDISTGAAISGALVNLQDSAAHSWLTNTDSKGKFTFTSTPAKPIVAGQVIVGASKDHYKTITETATISAKSITNWRVPLKLVVVASPSASVTDTPTPSLSDTGLPSDETSTDATGTTTDTSTDGGLIGGDPGASSGSGLFKYVLIMGLILVVGGAGVIGIMFYRRRKDDSGGAGAYANGGRDDDPGPRGGSAGRPGYRPAGGRAAEPTMVSRSGLGDAPTMMHNRSAVDEFADPYGAPAAPRGPRPGQRVGGGPGPGGGAGAGLPPRRAGGYDQNQYADAAPGYRPPPPRQGADQYQNYQPAPQPGYASDPTGYMGQPPDRSAGYPQRGGYTPAGARGGYQPSTAHPNQEYPPGPNDYGTAYPAQPGGYQGGGQNGAAYPDQGYVDQGYPSQGYADQGYSGRGGYADQGYQDPGYQDPGYQAYQNGGGYASGGHDVNGYGSGYDANGYDRNGYDAAGYNADGYNADGYNADGYNAEGYNAAGYNAEGYHVAGYSAYPGDFGAPSTGYQQGGYRGGYTPPDQRGSVDWLDD